MKPAPVTAQSYAGLGDGAERSLGAAATTVLFQCPDPERLLVRAGAAVTYRKSIAAELRPTQFAIRKPFGTVTARESEEGKLHPDRVRQLPIGSYLLPSGGYQKLHVSRLALPLEVIAAARAVICPADVHRTGQQNVPLMPLTRPTRDAGAWKPLVAPAHTGDASDMSHADPDSSVQQEPSRDL